MFCPNCGAEYREGFTMCSACNVSLVTELPGQIEPGFIKFVTVYETGDPALIAFAKSILQSEGIKYFIRGEGIQELFAGGRLGTGFNPVIGPVQIQVDEKDVEKAKDLFSQVGWHIMPPKRDWRWTCRSIRGMQGHVGIRRGGMSQVPAGWSSRDRLRDLQTRGDRKSRLGCGGGTGPIQG